MADAALEEVDGLKLDDGLRRILRPGELMRDRDGRLRRLPRFFYRIPSWEVALETPLSPHFEVWEFLKAEDNLERPTEVFGELKLLQMLEQFFDRAIYYAAVGYEQAKQGTGEGTCAHTVSTR